MHESVHRCRRPLSPVCPLVRTLDGVLLVRSGRTPSVPMEGIPSRHNAFPFACFCFVFSGIH